MDLVKIWVLDLRSQILRQTQTIYIDSKLNLNSLMATTLNFTVAPLGLARQWHNCEVFKVFFLMVAQGWQITQAIPYRFKGSQMTSLFSEESSKQHIYFPSEYKGFNLVSTKTGLWKEKEKNYFELNVSVKVLQNWTEFKSPLNLPYLKCTKSSLHGLVKELKLLQRFYLKKAVTFQRVLSETQCWITKLFTEIFKIFTKPSKLKSKVYAHLPEKSALSLRNITAILCCTVDWS